MQGGTPHKLKQKREGRRRFRSDAIMIEGAMKAVTNEGVQ
jgi:hypothetical protein